MAHAGNLVVYPVISTCFGYGASQSCDLTQCFPKNALFIIRSQFGNHIAGSHVAKPLIMQKGQEIPPFLSVPFMVFRCESLATPHVGVTQYNTDPAVMHAVEQLGRPIIKRRVRAETATLMNQPPQRAHALSRDNWRLNDKTEPPTPGEQIEASFGAERIEISALHRR